MGGGVWVGRVRKGFGLGDRCTHLQPQPNCPRCPVPTQFARLWPAANFVNFRFVPPEQRILYVNAVYIGWVSFLVGGPASSGGRGASVLSVGACAVEEGPWGVTGEECVPAFMRVPGGVH